MAKRRSMYEIDDGALDQESRRHAEEIGKFGELKADAKARKATLERRLSLIEADLKLKMRLKPDHYDLPARPPMELINAAILIHPKYRKVHRKLIKVQNEIDMYAAVVSGLYEMGKDITNIIELHKTNYYTDPERRQDYQSQHEEAQRAARSAIKKKRRKER